MVVGRRPFTGESPIAIALEKIRKEPPQASDAVPSLPPVWSAVIRRCLDPKPERRFAAVQDAVRQLDASVNRTPLISLTRSQKRALGAAALIAGVLIIAAWRYSQSTYTPARESLRLYRLGVHAQQLGLPWQASQLFERALEGDSRFVAARTRLAEVWMDMDQPVRAKAELQRAAAMRPRWQRLAPHEGLLEQAANAQLRGDLSGSVRRHERATAVAPEPAKLDTRFSEAGAKARAGDLAGAAAGYRSIADVDPSRCVAFLGHAMLLPPSDPERAHQIGTALPCFEAARRSGWPGPVSV